MDFKKAFIKACEKREEDHRKGKDIANALKYVEVCELREILYTAVTVWMKEHGHAPINAAKMFEILSEMVIARELKWRKVCTK